MTLREKLLLLGLSISLVANILLLVESKNDLACNDDNRYSAGVTETIGCVEMTEFDSNDLIKFYCGNHCAEPEYANTGFNISKRAITQIFEKDLSLNTISTDLVYWNKKITLVFRGTKLESTGLEQLPTATGIFRVQSVCPFECTINDCKEPIKTIDSGEDSTR